MENNDYLEYLKDIENNETNVAPDTLAPDIKFDGRDYNEYSSQSDPEFMKESRNIKNKKVNEKIRESRLQENAQEDIRKWAHEHPNGATIQDYMDSPYYNPAILPYLRFSIEKYIKNGKIPSTFKLIGTPKNPTGKGQNSETRNQPRQSNGKFDKMADEPYGSGGDLPEEQWDEEVRQLSKEYGDASLRGDDGTADGMFRNLARIVEDICTDNVTEKWHALAAGDPGCGKTYEVTHVASEAIKRSPTKAKLVYESGDMGAAISNLVAFFYANNANKVIILDDNDSMLRSNDIKINNFFKGLLDPGAASSKPVDYPLSVRKIATARSKEIEDDLLLDIEDLRQKLRKREVRVIDIDVPRLKEGILRVSIDGVDCINDPISLQEANNLYYKIKPLREQERKSVSIGKSYIKKMYEKKDETEEEDEQLTVDEDAIKDFMEGYSDKPEPEFKGEDDEDLIPRRFLFNSKVIFVSNMKSRDVNSAILDRCESVEISLTLSEFMDRLAKIMHGLGNKESRIYKENPEIVEWAKKCCFTALKGVVAAFEQGAPLFGGKVIFRRKLTFRGFSEFVGKWIRLALIKGQEEHKSISNQHVRQRMGIELIPEIIRQSIIPWISQSSKSE